MDLYTKISIAIFCTIAIISTIWIVYIAVDDMKRRYILLEHLTKAHVDAVLKLLRVYNRKINELNAEQINLHNRIIALESYVSKLNRSNV